jgi:PAS domain S-box-containing protein
VKQAEINGILESITEAFFAVDPEWRLTYINRKAEEFWGKQREELLGTNVWEAFPRVVGSASYHTIIRAAKERKPTECEAISPVMGSWIHLRAYPLEQGILVSFQDISERKQAEEALREPNARGVKEFERHLQALSSVAQAFGQARDLISVFRALLDFVVASAPCNGIFISLFDASRQERTCVYAWSEGREEDASALPPLPMNDSPNSEAIRTGRAVVVDDRLPRMQNLPSIDLGFDVDPRPPRSSISVPMQVSGRILGAFEIQSVEVGAYQLAHVTTLTMAANLAAIAIENVQLLEREQEARLEAEEAEKRFRELVADLDAVVWEAEAASRRFTFVSHYAQELLGYPVERWVQEPKFWLNLIHPEDRETAISFRDACLRSGRNHELEYRALTADGRTVWLKDMTQVVLNEQSLPQKLRGIMIDVTDQKQAELARRKQELEHALAEQMAAERRRIGQELHDGLVQQLVGIKMLAANLHAKLHGRSAPEAALMKEFTNLLGEANTQVRQLINGLVPVKVDVGSFVPALERVAANIEQWYGSLCSVQCEHPFVLKDDETTTHLFHIAQEAMINAARHSKGSQVDVILRVKGKVLTLVVHDNGVGLPANPELRGGMGLRNMQYRAELIGAALTVAQGKPKGTTVTCTLSGYLLR